MVCNAAKTNSGLNATLAATLVGSITSKIAISATKIGTGITPTRFVVLGEIKPWIPVIACVSFL